MENIMLDEKKKNVKIIDFGLSNTFSKDELLKTPCGSPEYAAPELFQVGSQYGPEVDIWSLGIIFYAAVIGRLPFTTPFTDQYRRQKLQQQMQKGLSSQHDKEMVLVTQDCRNILRQIIEPVPELRLALFDIESHPWTTKNGKLPFIPYQTPPKDKNMRAQVLEELSVLKNMDKKYVSEAVSESRADELSAMFNMMMDEQKKTQGMFDIDHTVPRDDKELTAVEKKSKFPKSAEHARRDKKSQSKTPRKHVSLEANKSDSVDGKVEAESVVDKTMQPCTEKAASMLLAPPPHLPADGTTVTVSKMNGTVRGIQHPLSSKTNASLKPKVLMDIDTKSRCSTNPHRAEDIVTKTTTLPQTQSRVAEGITVTITEDKVKSKLSTSRRIPNLECRIDNSDQQNTKSLCERERKPQDKPPPTKPLRPSTLQCPNNKYSDVCHTQVAYMSANKAKGAIPKYTGWSPLIAPRAVPETLSSTDPTPDSMQTSLLTPLEGKHKQSQTVPDRDKMCASQNVEMLERQGSCIKCEDESVRPLLVRYLSEPEHEDSGASQTSITGSNTLYHGSGPLVPSTNRLPVRDAASPKTDPNLLCFTSGNDTLTHPISPNAKRNICQHECHSTSHVCRTTHDPPVQIRLDNEFQRQDSNGNTVEDCADVFSSPEHVYSTDHLRDNVLAWQPHTKKHSPSSSSSADNSPMHGSPRLKRLDNINIQRKTAQMPIANVDSEEDETGEHCPKKPLRSNHENCNQHTVTKPHTSIGNGTRTFPKPVRLKAEKRRSSSESARKCSKNGIFTSVPDNNLRMESIHCDCADSVVADTSTNSNKSGDGSHDRLTNKARVHPMDINKEEESQNASNGSVKTSSKMPRPSSRLGRFQVFNLLQHDSDKNIRPRATSPTQQVIAGCRPVVNIVRISWYIDPPSSAHTRPTRPKARYNENESAPGSSDEEM